MQDLQTTKLPKAKKNAHGSNTYPLIFCIDTDSDIELFLQTDVTVTVE